MNNIFKLSGTVVHGEKVGRTIGFPTANLTTIPSKEELRPGVYVGYCSIYNGGELLWHDIPCLPYFGPRHIFGEEHDVFEVYLYDFDHQIYGHTLDVRLVHFLREPKKINSLEELKSQLETDKAQGLELLHAHDSHPVIA